MGEVPTPTNTTQGESPAQPAWIAIVRPKVVRDLSHPVIPAFFVLFVVSAAWAALSPAQAVVNGIIIVFGLLSAYVDFHTGLIPNRFTYPALISGLVLSPVLYGPRGLASSLICISLCLAAGVGIDSAGRALLKKEEVIGMGLLKMVLAFSALMGVKTLIALALSVPAIIVYIGIVSGGMTLTKHPVVNPPRLRLSPIILVSVWLTLQFGSKLALLVPYAPIQRWLLRYWLGS